MSSPRLPGTGNRSSDSLPPLVPADVPLWTRVDGSYSVSLTDTPHEPSHRVVATRTPPCRDTRPRPMDARTFTQTGRTLPRKPRPRQTDRTTENGDTKHIHNPVLTTRRGRRHSTETDVQQRRMCNGDTENTQYHTPIESRPDTCRHKNPENLGCCLYFETTNFHKKEKEREEGRTSHTTRARRRGFWCVSAQDTPVSVHTRIFLGGVGEILIMEVSRREIHTSARTTGLGGTPATSVVVRGSRVARTVRVAGRDGWYNLSGILPRVDSSRSTSVFLEGSSGQTTVKYSYKRFINML